MLSYTNYYTVLCVNSECLNDNLLGEVDDQFTRVLYIYEGWATEMRLWI